LLQIIFALRQVLAIAFGLVCGLLGLTGLYVLALFFASNLGAVYLYCYNYMKIDSENIEGNDIYTEGLMIAFSEFLLFWILGFTAA